MRAIDTAVINTEFGTSPEHAIGRARVESSGQTYAELLKELEERAPLYGLYDQGFESVRDRLTKLAAREAKKG
jgi:hypothetical protein